MISIALIFLVILFVLGYVQIPFVDFTLFNILGRTITLYDLLIFLLVLWVIEILPWPFRGLAGVILVLWLLSFFGIIAIAGLPNILVLALIIGIIAYIFKGARSL